MNRIEFIGRIANDIAKEVSEEDKKKPLIVILAVDNFRKDENGNTIKGADFIFLKAWGKIADRIRTYKNKGDEIFVEGRIKAGFYEDKKDNQRKYFCDNVIESVSFLRNTFNNSQSNNEEENEVNTSEKVNAEDASKNVPGKETNDFEVGGFDSDDIVGSIPFIV